jgi:hypothetical protein
MAGRGGQRGSNRGGMKFLPVNGGHASLDLILA